MSKLKQAADALRQSNSILIYTGAGMSADSNVPTFRDTHGFWRNFRPFAERGLSPSDLASPDMFRKEPHHSWAFYEWRRRNIMANLPHRGYHVIQRWLERSFARGFVHTTNTDGMHLRAQTPKHLIHEKNGSLWDLQCLDACSDRFWRDDRIPLCSLDVDTMSASDFPRCDVCGSIARPRVLMWDDQGYLERPGEWERFHDFEQGGAIDVVLVIGTSGWISWPERSERKPHLININLDPDNHQHYDDAIALTLPAEEALLSLEQLLSA